MKFRARSVVKFGVILLAVLGCHSMLTPDTDFHASTKILDVTADACKKNIDNKPLAIKNCFPLLDDKEILVEVTKVDNYYGLTIRGAAGREGYEVWCEPSEEGRKKILKNPETIKIGSKYVVKGKLKNFSTSGHSDTFTLENCIIKEWNKAPKS